MRARACVCVASLRVFVDYISYYKFRSNHCNTICGSCFSAKCPICISCFIEQLSGDPASLEFPIIHTPYHCVKKCPFKYDSKGSSIIVIIFTSVHSVRWGGGGQGRPYAFVNDVF